MSNVVKVSLESRKIFNSFLSSLELSYQELNIHSDKPLVIHNQMNQLSYICFGKGYVVVDNKIKEICEGDFVLIPKGSSHSFFSADKMKLCHYHWPKKFFDSDREILQHYYSGWDDYINRKVNL